MKVGVLTGGGDCPGLNAVIRALVKKGTALGYEFIGIKDGWKGLLISDTCELNIDNTEDLLHIGGTIIGTSRTNPYKNENDVKKVKENISSLKLDVVVAIGGNDTLSVAAKLNEEGINTIGVPKTIDNDLSGTDLTFGFDTAVQIVTDCIDKLHTTASSHHRVMVVEVMGRHAGWIALNSGIAGNAHVILLPETPFDMDKICATLEKREEEGKGYSIICASEGATPKDTNLMVLKDEKKDAFGNVALGGIGQMLEKEIEKRTGIESRSVVLGHIQRGGTPTSFDRILSTRYGLYAAEMIKDKKFGLMAALKGNEMVAVDMKEAANVCKVVDEKTLEEYKDFLQT